jgi:hypothetical protein
MPIYACLQALATIILDVQTKKVLVTEVGQDPRRKMAGKPCGLDKTGFFRFNTIIITSLQKTTAYVFVRIISYILSY